MLGKKFARDENALGNYIDFKVQEIGFLLRLESELGAETGPENTFAACDLHSHNGRMRTLDYLRGQLVATTEGGGCEHFDTADVDVDEWELSPWPPASGAVSQVHQWWHRGGAFGGGDQMRFARFLAARANVAAAMYSLRAIRSSAAKDAINALALNDLVNALAQTSARICYRSISRGRPDHYRWDAQSCRFEPGRTRGPGEAGLHLLGPSTWLVRKHANRLPIGDAAALAMISRIPVKSISPSNQLSYVVSVSHANQQVLLCGDSGFSDVMIGRSKVEPLILDELRNLDVVQVAHHAGRNQWFYPVLVQAWQGRTRPPAILLVSHSEHDRFRPGREFQRFVKETDTATDQCRIVFTSQPLAVKVAGIRHWIFPNIGVRPASVGDVRLEYAAGLWQVVRHAVQV